MVDSTCRRGNRRDVPVHHTPLVIGERETVLGEASDDLPDLLTCFLNLASTTLVHWSWMLCMT